jgi:hypothetical protein
MTWRGWLQNNFGVRTVQLGDAWKLEVRTPWRFVELYVSEYATVHEAREAPSMDDVDVNDYLDDDVQTEYFREPN